MADLPKTNSNWHNHQVFVVAASFTQQLPSGVGLHILAPAGALAGTNSIVLPPDTKPGDDVWIVSQYGITGITVSVNANSTDTILAGPAAVTSLTAGARVGYTKKGNTWLRIQ